jgi:Tfp pilus assembly protein PilV
MGSTLAAPAATLLAPAATLLAPAAPAGRRREAGFTLIEVMVSILLTAIAVIGMIGLYRVQARSSSYSRRSTEAAVLAGDKLEVLRTTNPPASSTTDEVINSLGQADAGGPFTRRWIVTTPVASQYKLQVQVDWDDDGTTRTVNLYSVRGL